MKIKKFNNVLSFTFKSIIRNPKLYIFSIGLPFVMLLILFLITFKINSSENIGDQQFSSYILIPGISIIVLVSSILFEWKKTVFLKQINNYNISSRYIVLSMFIVMYIVVLISSLVTVLWLYVLSKMFSLNIFNTWINKFNNIKCIAGTIYLITLEFIFIFAIAKILSIIIKNIYILQTINIIILIMFIFLGFIFLNMSSEFSKLSTFMLYLNPINYFCWSSFYFYIDLYSDKNNMFFINPSVDQTINVSNPVLLITLLSIIIILLGTLSSIFIKIKLFER